MKHILKISLIAIVLVSIINSCSNEPKRNMEKELEALEAEMGEDARDVGGAGEGEEDGTQFRLSDVYDVIKNGAHLILAYDAENNLFKGTVENTSDEVLEKVRVEVHLSNGIELGPTTAVDLEPGEKVEVKLEASEKDFETWSTHAEVGSSEHSHEGGEGEHSDEEDDGHDKEGEEEYK
jgi:predicted DNA-binding antitoxin AbrB/MazE fold protein